MDKGDEEIRLILLRSLLFTEYSSSYFPWVTSWLFNVLSIYHDQALVCSHTVNDT